MWHTCILCFAGKSIISNDGATILKNLDIVHPAAKTLVDIAKSQDAEVSIFTSMNFKIYSSLTKLEVKSLHQLNLFLKKPCTDT